MLAVRKNAQVRLTDLSSQETKLCCRIMSKDYDCVYPRISQPVNCRGRDV